MTLDEKMQHILAIAGALVTVLSAVSSLLNHVIRAKTDKGEEVSKALLGTASVINLVSVNLDKATQLGKMAAGKSVPQTALPTPPDAPKADAPKPPAA